ncbi:MAG: UbiA prenyltransferase family protein [Peptostreptococcales bacterium]
MVVYLKLLRVKHYIKNILIFLPLTFSRNLTNPASLIPTLIGALSFCLLSSVIYIINDIKDLDSDRNHPDKKNRPLASGAVSMHKALYIAMAFIFLSLAVLFGGIHVNRLSIVLLMAAYFLLNLLYSFKLKHLPLWDITILASGFLLRVLIGGQLANVSISGWLYMCVISMSFYLVLTKRRNELKKHSISARAVLNAYSIEFLENHMHMFLTISIVFYSLWVLSYQDIDSKLIWTIPLVMIVSMKYNLSMEKSLSEDPVEILYSDKSLLALVLFYALSLVFFIY